MRVAYFDKLFNKTEASPPEEGFEIVWEFIPVESILKWFKYFFYHHLVLILDVGIYHQVTIIPCISQNELSDGIPFSFFYCNAAFVFHQEFHHIQIFSLNSQKYWRLILKISAIKVEKR